MNFRLGFKLFNAEFYIQIYFLIKTSFWLITLPNKSPFHRYIKNIEQLLNCALVETAFTTAKSRIF